MLLKTKNLFFIAILFTAFAVQAQRTQGSVWIDQFEQNSPTTLLNETWFTYTDQLNKGASLADLQTIITDKQHHQALSFCYTLEKSKCPWSPYVAVACSLSGSQLDMLELEGIVYDYKGSDHNFLFRTSDVKDFGYYQYAFPESEDWTTVFIPFNILGQPKWGKPAIFDKQKVHSLAWQKTGSSDDSGTLLLDNIRLSYQIDDAHLTIEQRGIRHAKIEQQQKTELFIKNVLSNDSLQTLVGESSARIKKHLQALDVLKHCEQQSDSISKHIRSSKASKKNKIACSKLLILSKNQISGDTYTEIRSMDSRLALKCNKLIALSSYYELEKNYLISRAIVDSNYLWIKALYDYSYSDKVNYTSGAISDSNFHYEIEHYHFKKNDIIAEIGAGRAFFERALSKYCNDLTVYVNELDLNLYQEFKTKLVFLEHLDNKNIHYVPVQGTDSTSNLPKACIDKIIIKNTFHHFSAPDKMLHDFKRSLKPDGSIFITDTMKDEVVNPECKQLMTRAEVMKWLTESGFTLVNETKMQYGKYTCLEFQLKK